MFCSCLNDPIRMTFVSVITAEFDYGRGIKYEMYTGNRSQVIVRAGSDSAEYAGHIPKAPWSHFGKIYCKRTSLSILY